MSSLLLKPGIVLGIDGGGSKTAALIASFDKDGKLNVLGQGRAGPSNLSLAGKQRSLASLDKAVDEALAGAGLQKQKLHYAVLALAGSTFSDVRNEIIAWAVSRNLATNVDILNDAEPVACSNRLFHQELISSLSRLSPSPDPVRIIDEPVYGCLKIAWDRINRPNTNNRSTN